MRIFSALIVLTLFKSLGAFCQGSYGVMKFDCLCEDSVVVLTISYIKDDEGHIAYDLTSPPNWTGNFYLLVKDEQISLIENVTDKKGIVLIPLNPVLPEYRRITFANPLGIMVRNDENRSISFAAATTHSPFFSEMLLDPNGIIESLAYYDGYQGFNCSKRD